MTPHLDNIQRSNLQQRGTQFNWNGFHRALVIDSKDKKLLGRVKCRIPDLMPEPGADFTKDWKLNGIWAHPANNYMGGRNIQDTMGSRASFEDAFYQGSCLVPPSGSWVWVFFENGEPNHPYYFGSLEAGQRKVLPENQEGAEWWNKWTLIKTKQGRCIVISDDPHDCRIEITGKKRLITNPPDGDQASVYAIDDNQTVILLDERDGKGKLMLKDYRGNYITMHIDDEYPDQLHVFFKEDIHIESLKTIKIKAGEDIHMDAGENIRVTAGSKIETKAGSSHKEKARSFDRFALQNDKRTALCKIEDTGGSKLSHCSGAKMECGTAGTMKMNGGTVNVKGDGVLNLEGGGTANLKSGGPVNVNGAITNVQCGAGAASSTFPLIIAGLAASAILAKPKGDRLQDSSPAIAPDPIVPVDDMDPPPPIASNIVPGDPYNITFGGYPRMMEAQPLAPLPESSITPNRFTPTPSVPVVGARQAGVGHMFTMQLKNDYRNKIIPLVDKSCGTFTGFNVFKDVTTDPYLGNIDSDFYDGGVIPIYDQYDTVAGWNDLWLTNLENFCTQANQYDITTIATLFDFKNSITNDPFVKDSLYPYTTLNWNDSFQGEHVRQVVDCLKRGKYIINLGSEYYLNDPILPDNGWFRKLIMFLIDECGVSSNQLALTAGPSVNLFDRNPYCQYKVYTDSIIPQDGEINNQEFVDYQWGGTGRVAVYDENGNLIGGYLKYLLDCGSNSIPCMSTWKMNNFFTSDMDLNDPNLMNYVFAPRQREAMRRVLCSNQNNDGFIDFT